MKVTNTARRRKRGVRRRKGSRRNFRNMAALRLLVEGLRRVPPQLCTVPPEGPPTCSPKFENEEYLRLVGAIYQEPPLPYRQVTALADHRQYSLWMWMAVVLWPYIRIIPKGERCGGTTKSRTCYFKHRYTGSYGIEAFAEATGLSPSTLTRLPDRVRVATARVPLRKPKDTAQVGTASEGTQQVVVITDASQAPKQAAGGVDGRSRKGSGAAVGVDGTALSYALALLERWLELEEARLDGRVGRARKRRVQTLSRKGPGSCYYRSSSVVLRAGGKRLWLSVRSRRGRPLDINELGELCLADIIKRWPSADLAGGLDPAVICDDSET
jgi:hypothetical protein